MQEKVKEVLAKVRPGLGGTDVALMDVSEGVVKLRILTSNCGPSLPEEIALEILEDQLKEEIPEVKKVIAV